MMWMSPVDALDSIGSITVTVPFRNLWRLRLGALLLSLAGFVLRCPIAVEQTAVRPTRVLTDEEIDGLREEWERIHQGPSRPALDVERKVGS